MRRDPMGLALVLAAGMAVLPGCVGENQAVSTQAIAKGGDARTGEYDAVPNWWKPAPDHDERWTWGELGGIVVDNPDRIIVGAWGDREAPGGNLGGPERPGSTNYIVVVDRDGNIIERWSQWDSILNTPHNLYISPYDPERHVWVLELGGNGVHEQILKFTNDGSELVMRLRDPEPLGEDYDANREVARVNPHPGPYDFGQQSTMVFFPDGSFLLSDGYFNSRVVKYNAQGEYLMEWGELGSGPGQFDLVHGIAVDRSGRVYVADRANSRIQVFTEDGEFIEEWPDVFFPVDIHIDENEAVWVTSAVLNRIFKYNTDGELLYYWGTSGGTAGGFGPGGMLRPHQIDVDQEGNVYVVNWDSGHADKYVPKPDADPSKLIGRELVLDP